MPTWTPLGASRSTVALEEASVSFEEASRSFVSRSVLAPGALAGSSRGARTGTNAEFSSTKSSITRASGDGGKSASSALADQVKKMRPAGPWSVRPDGPANHRSALGWGDS